MTSIKYLAEVYCCQFDRGNRPDGREYYFVSRESDGSLQKLVDYVFQGESYNDTSFEFINNALNAIDGYDDTEQIELTTDPTHKDLMNWLSDNYSRSVQVNEIVNSLIAQHLLGEFNLFDCMRKAYIQEAYEVLYAVISYLQEQINIRA